MMGKDIERMIKSTDNIKQLIEKAVDDITAQMIGPLEIDTFTIPGHCPGSYSVPAGDPKEKKKPFTGSLSSLMKTLDEIEDDCWKMSNMDSKNYCDKKDLNNSIGSPWSEFAKLKVGIKDASDFYDAHNTLDYIGEKAAMCALLNTVLSLTIDAKWALITYNDYTQRGFDNLYNNNESSITFTNDVKGTQTNGNIAQKIDNNVSVKEESIDPY